MRVSAADIDIAGVVPGLRGVGEQVDGADGSAQRAGGATCRRSRRNGDACGQAGVCDEFQELERAARPDGAGAWRRVVDEVGALEMNAASTEVAELESGFAAETLFDGGAPLLDVLGGRVGIEGSEADSGFAEDGGSEIQRGLRLRGGQQGCRRREIVELLSLRENVGNVVALVAPGVEINRSEEDAVRAVENEAEAGSILRYDDAGVRVGLGAIQHSAAG